MTMPKTLPTYFISHGGGPWPWLKKEMPFYARLEAALQDMPRQIGTTPKAILVISAHWETREFAVMAHPQPPMLYDYGGFPPHTYQVQYPAPGCPELAARVETLLQAAGMPVHLDRQRGFDHGTFSPLVVMYPDAKIPIVQLSILKNFDPMKHIELGRALQPLRSEGILIVASGLSYHNLGKFGPEAKPFAKAFDDWLHDTFADSDPARIADRLTHWSKAPSARIAHPREDHLMPLMVAFGAARGEPIECVYHEDDFIGGIAVSSFRFGIA